MRGLPRRKPATCGTGPALILQNMGRLRDLAISKVIVEGRNATQMQGFAQVLKPDEIEALTAFVSKPLDKARLGRG